MLDIIKKTLCADELQSSVSDVEDLYPWYTAVCIFYAFLSYSAIMLNSVTIHAVRKTSSSLSKPLKTLLLSLAVSDLGVGVLVQPLFIALLINKATSCNIKIVFRFMIGLFSSASLFGVMALSADRFLAIHLHLRYQELVTHKRVVSVVFLIWLCSFVLSIMGLLIPNSIIHLIFAAINVVCLVLTTLVYARIYFVVRRHSDQIQVLQVHQETPNGQAANVVRLTKSAVGTFYVYLAFLVCYLPQIVDFVVIGTTSNPRAAVTIYSLCSWTLIFLNSSLNPVIYCWKMRHIRHAILDILRGLQHMVP